MIDINSLNEIQILWDVLPKVLVATICGGIIGIEREIKNKVAGIRTNILICAGSTLFTVASALAAQMFNVADPTRILSTIVTGIGFLGGGVIMQNEDKLVGITTASFIWAIAAIGILCGMGFVILPIVLTIGLLAISLIFEKVEKFIRRNRKNKDS